MTVQSQQIEYIVELMKDFKYPWFIAGGWSIDLGLGQVTREHHDLDITVYREHTEHVLQYFKEWEISVAIPGEHRIEKVETFSDIDLPRYCLHLHKGNEFIEIMLTDTVNEEVIFRKNADIRLSKSVFEKKDDFGRPYIAPEWQLLYKSKEGREKDTDDFEAALPHLDLNAKAWLKSSLLTFKSDSPWLEKL